MIHYFAYGSNLHPLRLIERVPSASLIGVAGIRAHRLSFHKKGKDNSSKCNLLKTGSESDLVHGALYEIDPAHKAVLDGYEGNGFGYTDNSLAVEHNGREYSCFTYQAQESHIVEHLKPFHWYKELVVLGAIYLKFPQAYIASIRSVASVPDPDSQRRQEHESLIEKLADTC